MLVNKEHIVEALFPQLSEEELQHILNEKDTKTTNMVTSITIVQQYLHLKNTETMEKYKPELPSARTLCCHP